MSLVSDQSFNSSAAPYPLTRLLAAFKREYRRRHDDAVDEYIGKFKSSGRIDRREVREYESILRQRAFAASVLDIRALPIGRSDFQVY